MEIFDDAGHLCSWCGLSPANNESAGKIKSAWIAKAGDDLKPIMVQCALKYTFSFTLNLHKLFLWVFCLCFYQQTTA